MLRGDHLLEFTTVKFPSNLVESSIWSILFGVDAALRSSRVSIIHFFEMDIFAKSNSAGFCVFDYIDRIGATKYQLADTGNDSLTSPARPAAPKSHILNSIFYGVDQLKYSDYVLHTMSTSQ
jgi:hypothetical protein